MWTVIVIDPAGSEVVRTYLKPGIRATIGRAPDNTIMLTPMGVARHHGRIELRNGVPTYFDEEGSTGTKDKGQYIRGPTAMKPEDSEIEINGFRFTVERTVPEKRRKAAASAPAPGGPVEPAVSADPTDDSAESMLARRIQGIRQVRAQRTEQELTEVSRFATEWTEVVGSLRKLKESLKGESRIIDFSIGREERDVLLKVRDTSTRGYVQFMLADHHPNGKFPELEASWLLQMGAEDQYFQHPKQALEELMHRLAPRLV